MTTVRERSLQAASCCARPSIAFMITSLGFGGAPKQMKEVAIRLARAGWPVVGVISLATPENWVNDLRRSGIPVYSLEMRPDRPDPRCVSRARRLLRELQPDILVTFLFHASLVGWVASRLTGVGAVVCSVRSERFGSQARELVVRLGSGLGDRCVVNSERVAVDLVARRILKPERCAVVPNGFADPDGRAVPEIGRSAFDIPDNCFVWLAVGWLLGAKDYPTMLRAFALLKTPGRLLIAGTGPDEADLRLLAADLDIEGRVRFLGLRQDIPGILRMADGFVSSSAWEGMPNAIMEAMAAGKPVVATSVGGTTELIEHERTGFLVPPNSPRPLAAMMETVMTISPRQRQQIGTAGRHHILETYGWDRIISAWEIVLRDTMARATGSEPPVEPLGSLRS